MRFPRMAAQPVQRVRSGVIPFEGFPQGLNTSVPAEMITPNELSECVDWKYNVRGQLEVRSPIVKYTDTACDNGAVSGVRALIGGTFYTLVGDSGGKVYYLSGATPTEIDTAESSPQFLPYNNICLVLDGSYVKYLDGVSALKIAYDTGKYQVNNYNGDDDAGIAIGDGTNTRAAMKFTSLNHDAGYTIPVWEITAKLKRTGSPSGAISFAIRLVADDSVLATQDISTDAGSIATDGNFYTASFTSVTTEMSPDTDYYATVEFSGGDGSNHIELRCSDDASTGYHYASSAWSADTDHNPIMRVAPGLPPKASYGCISDKRPWLWGDADNPGYMHYGKLTHLEWGYVSVVDENKNSFEVGGAQDLYGDLWVYGTQDQPYLAVLTGDTEASWAINLRFQRAWTLPRTIRNIGNDIFTGSADGVDSLTGVQEYGDVRSFSESDNVSDRIQENWVSTAFAGYYPEDGQYWLYMPGYSKILVCHTKRRARPWTEYTCPATPTWFEQCGDNFFIFGDDGHIYTLDSSEYKDLTTTQIEPSFKTAYVEFPFGTVDFTKIQFVARSLTGASFNMKIYVNGNQDEPIYTYPFNLPLSDSLTVDDLIMDVDDMNFAVDPQKAPLWLDLNINCWSAQIEIRDLKLSGQTTYFNGMFAKYRKLEG